MKLEFQKVKLKIPDLKILTQDIEFVQLVLIIKN